MREAEEERARRSRLVIEAVERGTGANAARVDPDITAFFRDEFQRWLSWIEREQRILEAQVDRHAVARLERENDRLLEDVAPGRGFLDEIGVAKRARSRGVGAAS